MNLVRLVIAAVLAVVVTSGLFFLMFALIEMGDKKLDESPAQKIADITMPETEIETNIKEAKPEKPEDPEEPPPDVPEQQIDFDTANVDAVNMATPAVGNVDISLGAAFSDGDFVPLVAVVPQYPNSAMRRGLEGYCVVQFTITAEGRTRDPKVVECSNNVFARNSIKATDKLKYKPRVIDGQPIEVADHLYKFTYQLEK
jgi:protein TonB